MLQQRRERTPKLRSEKLGSPGWILVLPRDDAFANGMVVHCTFSYDSSGRRKVAHGRLEDDILRCGIPSFFQVHADGFVQPVKSHGFGSLGTCPAQVQHRRCGKFAHVIYT